jgi:hypothetical protein
MPNIDAILREINRDLVPQFEEKLRSYLAEQDREWLIEQIVRLTLDAHSLKEMDRKHIREQETRKRQERAERVKKLELDEQKLNWFVSKFQDHDRDRLVQENFLQRNAPGRGGELIGNDFRTSEGNELLQQAKDMLFGLLFGDESTNTRLQRTHQELLTLTLPRLKSEGLDFMQASTELHARGTWQDPDGVAPEAHADNIILEIEYGEMESGQIGQGVVTALRLINHLEINEEVLYGRMEKIQRSTLVS